MERLSGVGEHGAYRGTLRLGGGGIIERAPIGPSSNIQDSERQCMLTVVNKLLKRAKKMIVSEMDMRWRRTGTFDTTGGRDDEWRVTDQFVEQTSLHYFKYRIKARRRRESLEAEFLVDDPNELIRCGAIDQATLTFYLDRVPDDIMRRSDTMITNATREMSPEHPRCRSDIRHNPRRAESLYGEVRDPFLGTLYRQALRHLEEPLRFARFHPRNTPNRRAMALLARKIGKVRYRDLKKKGYFEEQGKHGIYRFHKNKPGGVTFIQKIIIGGLKERPVQWDLCVQSQAEDLPPGDVILSRWLEWKADEDRFLKTANFRNISTVDEAIEHPIEGFEQIQREMINSLYGEGAI